MKDLSKFLKAERIHSLVERGLITSSQGSDILLFEGLNQTDLENKALINHDVLSETVLNPLRERLPFYFNEKIIAKIQLIEILRSEPVFLGKIDIVDLKLSTRLTNALMDAGFKTINDLTDRDDQEFLLLKKVGTGCLNELSELLGKWNIQIKKTNRKEWPWL